MLKRTLLSFGRSDILVDGEKVKINGGFTFVEVAIALLLIALLAVGMSAALVYGLKMAQTGADKNTAVLAAIQRMESLRSSAYADLNSVPPQNGVTFPVFYPGTAQLLGRGNTRAVTLSLLPSPPNPPNRASLIEVTVTVCWRDRWGRLYGEDSNLNGGLDPGEDLNGNGLLDSPVRLTTRMASR